MFHVLSICMKKVQNIFCWFKFFWNKLKIMFRKKVISKKLCKKCKIKKLKIRKVFAYNFFPEHFSSPFQFGISMKFSLFWYPIQIVMKKIFQVIVALSADFECKCSKNGTFSDILQKLKTNCFANRYQSPFESHWNSKVSPVFLTIGRVEKGQSVSFGFQKI